MSQTNVDLNVKKLADLVKGKIVALPVGSLVIDDYFSHIVSFDICSLEFSCHKYVNPEKPLPFYFHIDKEKFELLHKALDCQIQFEWFPKHLNANVTIVPLGDSVLESF